MPNPRKPAAVHVLQGTSKKARLLARVNELHVPAGDVGAMPEWFDADAQEAWERITGTPEYAKALNRLHWGPLVQYCALWSKQVKALRGDPGAEKINTMEQQALTNLTMQFGLTPVSQAKVNLPTKKTEGKYDKFKTA